MLRPPRRPGKPPHLADSAPGEMQLAALANAATYKGSSKHKSNPLQFGLEPCSQMRGDATTCDGDAGFSPQEMQYVRNWMTRGIKAGLVSDGAPPRALWAVADSGWIFVARLTNATTAEYHGYPLLPGTPGAELIYHRFKEWVASHRQFRNSAALQDCKAIYGIKP